jgi:APA family basic amino acid/polyamine antiporter
VSAPEALASPGSVAPRGLLRVLGASFALAMAVGATIGGGILRTPGDVAALLPTAGLFLAAWALGAANALAGATAYAELGAMMPSSGGIYVFARRAFGDTVGFFLGYSDWVNWSIASAALILLAGEYLVQLVPPLAGHTTVTGFVTFALLVGLQLRGVRWGGRIQEITSVLKCLALVGLVAAAFLLPHAAPAPAAAPPAMPHGLGLAGAFALAMQGVIFTYDSYYAVVYCGEEIRDPGREIPRSMFRGLWLVSGIYLLVTAAFVSVIGVPGMANDAFVGGTVARLLFGQRGDAIIRAIMIISVLGTVNAQVIAAPRVLLAMSRDGLFSRRGDRVNAGGTPSVATLVTFLLIALFLFSGSFNALLGIDALVIVTGYLLVFASLFVLRRREPDTPRPYRARGYPWIPGLALVGAAAFLVATALTDVRDTAITLSMLVASWPAARIVRHYRARVARATAVR